MLLALSQADTISWPQTVPSTSGDGTAGTSLSQHQWQLWIWLGPVPALMVVAFGALPAGKLLEKLCLRPGWFWDSTGGPGAGGHPLCPATDQLPAQRAQPSPTTKHFQSCKKTGSGARRGEKQFLPARMVPSQQSLGPQVPNLGQKALNYGCLLMAHGWLSPPCPSSPQTRELGVSLGDASGE